LKTITGKYFIKYKKIFFFEKVIEKLKNSFDNNKITDLMVDSVP